MLYFQQVMSIIRRTLFIFFQAGLTTLDVKFTEWEWQESQMVIRLEHIGLGKIININFKVSLSIFSVAIATEGLAL